MIKYYGYKNTKANSCMGVREGGWWVEVSFIHWLWLKAFDCITKKKRRN